MKIAVMSDFHFGHGAGTELEQDSYEAVEQALEKSSGCDLILMPGDLFDTRVPGTETLAKAMQLLIRPSLSASGARLAKLIGKDEGSVSPKALAGIPIVTIHGTHERRTKELMNPVEALERAGFAMHLHCSGAVFEKSGEKVAVFGFSGVPDQYAGEELKKWDPKPEPGCYNIFMLHQNMREFMPPQIEHAIRTDELPPGFDLYLCGHIHESRRASKGSAPFLFPGSTINTQIGSDSLKPRGFFIVDTAANGIEFIELEGQRKVFIIESGDKEEIKLQVEAAVSGSSGKKPIIRVKLPAGANPDMVKEMVSSHCGSAIISCKAEGDEKREAAKTLEEHVFSVQEMGKGILERNLRSLGLDPALYESVFELLLDGRAEEAEKLVLSGAAPVRQLENKHADTPENTQPRQASPAMQTIPKTAAQPVRGLSGTLMGY